MKYMRFAYENARAFCARVFGGYGFSDEDSLKIADALLDADLSGIESHGIQRLVRYDREIASGMVDVSAASSVIRETPVSALIDGCGAMGQLTSIAAMKLAMEKAKITGIGMVTVRNSNHFGTAGHYARMALSDGLCGVAMTNSEAIMVPTFGKQPMLGTNPIAFSAPADPMDFVFDAATTVVPRGKLEVYVKRGEAVPEGWLLDENGADCSDPARVLKNIISKAGGGILPIGGSGETTSGYKGYGFGMICEIMTSIMSLGATSDMIYKRKGHADICHFFCAFDPGMFGDRVEIRAHFSDYLRKIRAADKADGADRIYTHGEKEAEARRERLENGILLNEKTLAEIREIAAHLSVDSGELDAIK